MAENIKVAVLRPWKRRVGPPQERDVALAFQIELSMTVEALWRGRQWRKELDTALKRNGVQQSEVRSVNVLAQPYHGCHVAVTLETSKDLALPARKPPVTRGGHPIETARPARTRATVRRGG